MYVNMDNEVSLMRSFKKRKAEILTEYMNILQSDSNW